MIFWNVALCVPVDCSQRFGRPCCINFLIRCRRWKSYNCSWLARTVVPLLPVHITLHLSPGWKHQLKVEVSTLQWVAFLLWERFWVQMSAEEQLFWLISIVFLRHSRQILILYMRSVCYRFHSYHSQPFGCSHLTIRRFLSWTVDNASESYMNELLLNASLQ